MFDSAATDSPRHAEYFLTAATVAAEYMDSGTFRHPLVRASLFHSLSMSALQSFRLSTDPRERPLTPAGLVQTHRHVLDRGQDLHPLRVAPGAGDRLADALQVGVHQLRGQPVDQLDHHPPMSQATPAWRPVTPRSRRWEKNSAGSEQIVQIPMS